MSALLVKYPDLQHTAQRAFLTYLKSIHNQKDKEIFDVMKLPIDEFAASIGLPLTPKIRFLNHKTKSQKASEKSSLVRPEDSFKENGINISKEELDIGDFKEEKIENNFLLRKDTANEGEILASVGDIMYVTPVCLLYKYVLERVLGKMPTNN